MQDRADGRSRAPARLLLQCIFWGQKTGPNPIDRAKLGSKRHLICDGRGVRRSAGDNDSKQALALVDAVPPLQGERVVHYPFRGVIWYQGESNAWRPQEYRTLLTTMIESWRTAWDEPDFPLLIVQLPNHGAIPTEPGNSAEAGNKVTYVSPVFEPLAEAGFAWFSIDYRLTPITHLASDGQPFRNPVR